MKVCFETFGCRLNKAEALQMEAEYLAKGWETTKVHKEADLFIVRGCSVTRRAQEECEKLIAHLKRHYPAKAVRVCGCLPSAEKSIPPGDSAPDSVPVPTRTARAYLKVQDGCAGKCTFCIVPKFRGASRSVDFDYVLDRARRFVEAGYREIVVTGCNLALYASQGKRLPELLLALADVDAGCRIRLGSVEPEPGTLETVRAMAARPNICRFLHLPIQSGSNPILRAMQRPYLISDVDEIVETATELLPNLGLGCDLMTGFPGESELDFTATVGLLKRHPFTKAHVFPFSRRPGTIAAGFPNQLHRETKSARAHALTEMASAARRKFARSFVGKTIELVIEDELKGSGWTGEYLPCKIIKGSSIRRKDLVRAKVFNTKGDLLLARLINDQ